MRVEQVLQRVYAFLIRMYPIPFRQDFEVEMRLVFAEALIAAQNRGAWAVARLCLYELRDLPGALLREHWQIGRDKEVYMSKDTGFNFYAGDVEAGVRYPGRDVSRADVFLAVLPYLLILVAETLPKILVETHLLNWESEVMRVLTTMVNVLMITMLLLALYLGWRRKWPLWSASWFPFYVVLPIGLLGWLIGLLFDIDLQIRIQPIFIYQVIPLAVAVLLYVLMRLDRTRGLLAALPILYFLWSPNMEFVPDPIEIAIKIASTALVCLAIFFLMRAQDWRYSLYTVLVVNLVVGFLFSYAGIYHGGYLPFTAPRPDLVEVLRSMVPQYLATSAILIGSLFAWKFRQEGLKLGGLAKTAYHLALAGLLLIIIGNLGGLMLGVDPPSVSRPIPNSRMVSAEIILGMGIYIFSLVLLNRNTQLRRARAWVERAFLVLLPLALPIMLFLPFFSSREPMSSFYWIPRIWELPHDLVYLSGIIWLMLSTWLVTQDSDPSRPGASLVEAHEAPQPG